MGGIMVLQVIVNYFLQHNEIKDLTGTCFVNEWRPSEFAWLCRFNFRETRKATSEMCAVFTLIFACVTIDI